MTTQTQYDLAPANQPEFELTVTPVPDEQRIDFWPQYFGASTECDAMTAHYYRLRDYTLQHPESQAILRIID
ncbi:MAG: antirestriction protein [Escherichia coli]|nr:antirestriction protein [Escherichia coli]